MFIESETESKKEYLTERLMCEVEFFGRCMCKEGTLRCFIWCKSPSTTHHTQIVDLEKVVRRQIVNVQRLQPG